MANLPEKNITTVNTVTSIPSNTNVFINANGELVQASINDIVGASNVVTDATLDAMKEAVDNQFKVYSGSPILANTSKGYATDFTAYGRSEQKQYSGKNLLENTATSQTVGGLTFTVNEDKSIKVSGATTGANNFVIKNVTLSAGTYTLSGMKNVSGSTEMQLRIYGGTTMYAQLPAGTDSKSFTLTAETTVQVYINFNTVGITYSGTIYPMIRLASITDDTYEQYVGGTTSPNPTYSQSIKSVGDSGYYDGELLQGVYSNATGEHSSNTFYVCSKNPIPCKEGDNIALMYEVVASAMSIVYYDKDMKQVNYIAKASASELAPTAPANASYFHFSINENGLALTPSTAKKIVVTINGKYALIQKSVNKNLWEFGDRTFTLREHLYKTLPAGTYTFSAVVTSSDAETTYSRVYFGAKDGSTIAYADMQRNTRSSITVVCDKEIAYISLYAGGYYNVSVNDTATYTDIQLELNDTMTDFVEHEEQTTYIPLTEPLRSLPVATNGDYTDENGQQYIREVIGSEDGVYARTDKIVKLVADGTNIKVTEHTSSTDGGRVFYFNTTNIKVYAGYANLSNIMSTHYIGKYTSGADETSGKADGTCRLAYSQARIYLFDNRFASADECNAWLAENPVEFYVERATHIVEPFADQTPFYKMKTFDGGTLVSASDDAEMKVEVPTSRVAGVASEGWAKGNLAQIQMDNMASKLAELQTAIVNS